MTDLRNAAEAFASRCNCGTLQAEVLLERMAELLNAGTPPETLLDALNTSPAASKHPGDPLAKSRLRVAGIVQPTQ